MTLGTDHKEKVSLQYGFFYEYLNHDLEQMALANGYKEKISLQYILFYDSSSLHYFHLYLCDI